MAEDLKKRMDLVYRELVHKGLVHKRKDLAPLLDYDVSYTSQLFNGKVEITDRISKRFFEKAGISPKFLETGEGGVFEVNPATGNTKVRARIKPGDPMPEDTEGLIKLIDQVMEDKADYFIDILLERLQKIRKPSN